MFKRYSKLFLIVIILVTCEILAATPVVRATNPAIFIKPSTVIGDLTPAPGSVTQWKVNVSDIGSPGLIGYEFYMTLDPRIFPVESWPIANSNFTTNANGWTTTTTVTSGTATYGWNGADGNPTPGSGPGSYYLRATSTGTQIAQITFLTEYSFSWVGGGSLEEGLSLSFAYKISGNSIAASGASIHILVVKPDATTITLVGPKSYSTAQPWSYNFTAPGISGPAGTYKLRLRNVLKTAAAGTDNYVQVNWDDVGLFLTKVGVAEGPFLGLGGGSRAFTAKYIKYPTNTSLYVASSLIGEPWKDFDPVQGGGTIAYVNITTNYGVADLDLWGTKLLEPSLVPPYLPVEIEPHDAIDAYFDNRIPGDIAGPENPPGSGLYPYDGNVNNYDLTYLKTKFGTNDHQADFTGPENPPGSGTHPPDGIANVRDLQPIGKNYGRHYP